MELDRKAWTLRYSSPVYGRPAPMSTNWRPPPQGDGSTRYVYDSTNQLIVGAVQPGVVLGFRPRSNGKGEWLTHKTVGTGRTIFYCHAYVPRVNTHFIVADVKEGRRTFAFRWDPGQATTAVDPRPPAAHIAVNGVVVTTLQRACDIGGNVEIAAGELHDLAACASIRRPVSVRGAGSRLVARGIEGKGILLVSGDAELADLDISGARVADGNGAAIRHQAGNVKLKRVRLHGNQNGLLGPSRDIPFSLTIEDCEVFDNGTGTGQTHGLYVGLIDRFTCTGSRFRNTRIGHHIKSRARSTTITRCEIGQDFDGNESYNVDIPVGGDVVMTDCHMRQGPKTDNQIMVNYGSERNPHPGGSLKIQRCTFESRAGGVGIRNALPNVRIEVEDCDFIGIHEPVVGNHSLRNCRLNGKPMPDVPGRTS
jgi:hypothetical protein